jgi:hypothetical protein
MDAMLGEPMADPGEKREPARQHQAPRSVSGTAQPRRPNREDTTLHAHSHLLAPNGGTYDVHDFVRGKDGLDPSETGLTACAQVTRNTVYANSNWYGVGYCTGST